MTNRENPEKSDLNRENPEKSDLLTKPVDFLVLAVLSDGALHGYGLAQEMTSRTGGKVKVRPGSLYRVLDRLMRRGLLEKSHERPDEDADDERRLYYQLTPLGRRVAAEEAVMLAKVAAGVIATAEDPA
jgi:DNA-binding PadR family transcriptional regulator